MDVRFLQHLGIDAELSRSRLDQRQRGLRALLHHVPELAGQYQLARAGHARGLNKQDVTADRRPCQTRGDARHAGAHGDLGLELARSENGGEIIGSDF